VVTHLHQRPQHQICKAPLGQPPSISDAATFSVATYCERLRRAPYYTSICSRERLDWPQCRTRCRAVWPQCRIAILSKLPEHKMRHPELLMLPQSLQSDRLTQSHHPPGQQHVHSTADYQHPSAPSQADGYILDNDHLLCGARLERTAPPRVYCFEAQTMLSARVYSAAEVHAYTVRHALP
jgi:hypothetical protein